MKPRSSAVIGRLDVFCVVPSCMGDRVFSHPGWNGSRVANTHMDPHGD